MPLFNGPIKIVGKHAEILQKYSVSKGTAQDIPFEINDNDGQKKQVALFKTRLELYMVAGMLGIILKRKAPIDTSSSSTASIFYDIIDNNRNNLERIYQHMVLSENNDEDADTKIKHAFSVKNEQEFCDIEQNNLEDYVRGGLEYIDELFGKCSSYEDVCNAIIELIDIE